MHQTLSVAVPSEPPVQQWTQHETEQPGNQWRSAWPIADSAVREAYTPAERWETTMKDNKNESWKLSRFIFRYQCQPSYCPLSQPNPSKRQSHLGAQLAWDGNATMPPIAIIMWYFYACDKFTWISQKEPLDNFLFMLSSILCIVMIQIYGTSIRPTRINEFHA